MSQVLLDVTGRRRSPATLPGFHAGRPPRNKGGRYPADPPTIEEIVAAAGVLDGVDRVAGGLRRGDWAGEHELGGVVDDLAGAPRPAA